MLVLWSTGKPSDVHKIGSTPQPTHAESPYSFMQSYVISAAMRMSVSQLSPLLSSLDENAPDARVILLVNNVSADKRRGVKELNPKAKLHRVSAPYVKKFLRFPPSRARKAVLKPILGSLYRAGWLQRDEVAFAAMEPHISRYYYIQELLEELANISSSSCRVLLTDSRDVVVQSNPFKNVEQGVYCGLEDVKIGERALNHEWLVHLYGESVAHKLDDKYAACSGIIIGDIDSVHETVSLVISEAKENYKKCIFNTALDQGIFNKIVHLDGHSVNKLKNGNNLLVTSGTFNSKNLRDKINYKLDTKRGIVNEEGNIISIVHQYDRKEDFDVWIKNKYKNRKK